MQNIQEIYNRLEEHKGKAKKIKLMLKEAYDQDEGYCAANEAVKKANIKRKEIKTKINELFPKEVQELEDLNIDIASDKELLNDMILTAVMRGDKVEVTDKFEQQCFPIFQVKFSKVD